MSNFSHKGGAHENAAKKKETKEESFAHRMETLSGETDGRKKPSKKQKTRTLTVVLIVIAGVLALLLLLLLAYSIWSTAPETDDSGLKTQTTATPDMPTASATPAGATAQPSATPTASPTPKPTAEPAGRKDNVYTLLVVAATASV